MAFHESIAPRAVAAPGDVGAYEPPPPRAEAAERRSLSIVQPHSLTLRFDRRTEEEFAAEDFDRSLKHTRVVLLLGTVLYSAFGVGDAYVFPEFKSQLWLIRYAIALPVGIACLAFTFSPHFRRWRHVALSLCTATGAGGMLAMIALVPQSGGWLSSGSWLYYVGLLLVVIYFCALLRLRFVNSVAVSALILVSYLAIALRSGATPAMVAFNNFFALFAAVLLGLSANYVMERYGRMNYIQRRVIEARTEELQRRNDELRETNLRLDRSKAELQRSAQRAELIFSALTEALPGTVLDEKYRVDTRIDSGGFGTVYRGFHLPLQRPVALKIFRPTMGHDLSERLERFRLEGIASCRIHHPNAVTVLDFGVAGNAIAYLVMELLEGRSLATEMRECGRMSPSRCAEIICPICDVLAEAHAAGIIHRDIKPSNIFLQRTKDGTEVPKVIDFGIAKLLGDASETGLELATESGTLFGTLGYMAPERIDDRPYDGRADVYAIGVTVYEMLCGCLPFSTTGRSDLEMLMRSATHPAPELRQHCPEIARPLDELVRSTLARDPRRRPTARAFGHELRRLTSSETAPA